MCINGLVLRYSPITGFVIIKAVDRLPAPIYNKSWKT